MRITRTCQRRAQAAMLIMPTLLMLIPNCAAMVVIGHRGGVAHAVPEHTELAYTLGAQAGADFLEPDVVSSADGVLCVRHDVDLSRTTDVASRPEFAHLRTTKEFVFPFPQNVTDWFVEDFTVAELKTLWAVSRESSAEGGTGPFDRSQRILTLAEMLALVQDLSRREGRAIGVYPETKRPHHFRSLGLALEEPLLEALAANGFLSREDDGKYSPIAWPADGSPAATSSACTANVEGSGTVACPATVFLQSFEPASLLRMRSMVRGVPLVQLVWPRWKVEQAMAVDARTGTDGDSSFAPPRVANASSAGLAFISSYAVGVGVGTDYWRPTESDATAAPVVSLARSLGLLVHAYVLDRDVSEYDTAVAVGVTGVFTNDAYAAATWRALQSTELQCCASRDSCVNAGSNSGTTPPTMDSRWPASATGTVVALVAVMVAAAIVAIALKFGTSEARRRAAGHQRMQEVEDSDGDERGARA